MVAELEVDGYDELTRALGEINGDQVQALAVTAMTKSCLAVEGILKEYPEETASNRPGRLDEDGRPMGYYERNRGDWYPVLKTPKGVAHFGKAQGVVRAKKAQRAQGVAAYKLSPISQQLGKSWTTDVQVGKAEIIGVIGTDVTYAPAVQGMQQKAIFAQIGWVKLDAAVDQAEPDIQAAWQECLAGIHL